MNKITNQMNRITKILLFISIIVLGTVQVRAQLFPSLLFTNGMVLQRDKVIPVWGKGSAGQSITIGISGAVSVTGKIDANGFWKLNLPAMPAGGPYTMTLISGTQTLVKTDVYLGDVFIVSGQSNMAWPVNQTPNGPMEIAAANNQLIRQFRVNKALSAVPLDTLPAGSNWQPANIYSVPYFSAVAYYCAKELQSHIGNVPIGLVNNSYEGARIEAFMSYQMLGYDQTTVTLPSGEPEHQPTLIYNAMVQPLIGMPFKGLWWYQGESNCGTMIDAVNYESLFRNMINSYRGIFGGYDFPFYWIQLHNFGGAPSVERWANTTDNIAYIRNSMKANLALPNTGQAIAVDTGDGDIHPPNKLPLGLRLEKIIRNKIYGQNNIYSGPTYLSSQILANGNILVTFDNVGSGLKTKSTTSTTALSWFSLSKLDGTAAMTTAEIVSPNQVLINTASMPNPDYIRYAFQNNPFLMQFYNSEDLPAGPFLVKLKVDTQVPASPLNLKANLISNNFVNIIWNTSSDNIKVTGYKIYVNGQFYSTSTDTARKVLGLSPSTNYNFYVTAYDEAGNESAPSNIVNATTLALKPPAPIFCTNIEAEDATLVGVTVANSPDASNGKYVTGFSTPPVYRILFNVTVPVAGLYNTTIRYRAPTVDKINNIQLNTQLPVQINFPYTPNFADLNLALQLDAGANRIQIIANYGNIDVDKLSVCANNFSVLATTVYSFYGKSLQDKNVLNIDFTNDQNLQSVVLQRADDHNSFSTIKNLSNTWSSIIGKHEYADETPLNGSNLYRLEIVDRKGEKSYSNIVKLNNSKAKFSVYPNPCTNNINLVLPKGDFVVQLYDQTGRQIELRNAVSLAAQSINIDMKKYATGLYSLIIYTKKGELVWDYTISKTN